MSGGYKAFLRDLVRLEKSYQHTSNKGPMSEEVLGEFIISLEGVKMLIRSGVEIISMELERELDLQRRGNYMPWLKDSLVGSVSQLTSLFGQAVKSVTLTSSMAAPELEAGTSDTDKIE